MNDLISRQAAIATAISGTEFPELVSSYCPNCGASMMDDNATQHTECVENALDALKMEGEED